MLAVAGCVYCGLPPACRRTVSGDLVRLPACEGHATLLYIDPAYSFDGLAATLGIDEPDSASAESLTSRVGAAYAVGGLRAASLTSSSSSSKAKRRRSRSRAP